MDNSEDKSISSRASKIAIGISIVVCALLMMYACGQRNNAEKQYRIGEELRMQAERTRQECLQSKDALQETIDSLRMQIEDFESRIHEIQ